MNRLEQMDGRLKWEQQQRKENWTGNASTWYVEDIPALLAVVRAAAEWDRWFHTDKVMLAVKSDRLHDALAALLEEVEA